jgi:diguanylate cyclase (GGDEF)-like protein
MAIHDDPATDNVLGESTNLELVRLRLFLALVTMFAIPIVITAPMVYGLAWGFGASLVLPTLALLALAGILGSLTVWLSRRVLEPAERLEGARRILEDAYDRARSEALRDTLTGLGNHRAFQEEMERQWAGAVRHNQPLALAIVDLDDFKRINDDYGHHGGDRALQSFGQLLRAQVRDFDVAARLGGEEFAILLPQTTAEAATVVAARTRDTLAASPIPVSNEATVQLSASFGIAESSPGQTTDELLRRADEALYAAKRAGKNRYVVDTTAGVS